MEQSILLPSQNSVGTLFAYYVVQVFDSSMDNGRKLENQLPLTTAQGNPFDFSSKAPGIYGV